MSGVAAAFGAKLARDPALEQKLRAYFGEHLAEAHLKLAEVPEGVVSRGVPPLGGRTKTRCAARTCCSWPYAERVRQAAVGGECPHTHRRQLQATSREDRRQLMVKVQDASTAAMEPSNGSAAGLHAAQSMVIIRGVKCPQGSAS